MSTADRTRAWLSAPSLRTLALAGLATLILSFLLVLRDIVGISGDLSGFYLLVAVAVLLSTALARVLRVVVALALAVAVLGAGLLAYLSALPYDPAVGAMVESNLELLAGKSIVEIERSTVWALSVTPAPVFVTWYLGLRQWYTGATVVASGMLGYLVLTGDAGVTVTLLGVVGAAATLGFGDLAARDGSIRGGEYVAVVLAVMVLAPLLVSVVPGGSSGALSLGGGDTADTVEASLISTDSQLDIAGSIDLSPKERFTVTSAEAHYWRVGSYNRYTGDGWVRSGEPTSYSDDELSEPPGESVRLAQRFRVESTTNAMPAAWRPVALDDRAAARAEVTRDGGLVPEGSLAVGETYRVTSSIPLASTADLRTASGTDPPELADRYTQLPASTPDRVRQRTNDIVGNADSRYQTARRIERWLETNREYSLDVDKPDGTVADSFLFEMERGYCTYYATTMVTMLRTQDIPARMVVGYTPGERVGEEEYVVRGLDSHAWVEVYFPDIGWIQFDPTPAGPRQQAEQQRLTETGGDTNDTIQSPTPTATPTSTPNVSTPTPRDPTGPPTLDPPSTTPGVVTPDGGGGLPVPELPSPDRLVLGGVVVVGAVAGLRRSGYGRRAYRWVWLRYQPRVDPVTDIERTHRRLCYVLERRHRPRQSGETMRSYLAAIDADARAHRLAKLRERARYGNAATPETADEARELLREIRRQ